MSISGSRPWLAHYAELGIETPPFDDRPFAVHIAEHARARPKSPAMLFQKRVFTYAEYDKLAGRLAHALAALGISKGDVVGLHMPNLPQYAVAVAAVSRLGAIGTGISPLLAPEELSHQIGAASVKVLISFDLLAPALQGMPSIPDCLDAVLLTPFTDFLEPAETALPTIGEVKVERLSAVMDGRPDGFKQAPTHWDDTFMIQFTGGTTGRPKGAQLSIRNLMYNVLQSSAADPFDIGNEVFASAFPYIHVGGLTHCIASGRAGGCMTVVPDPRDVQHFCDLMKIMPPTRLASVPALYDMLLACPTFHEVDFRRLKGASTGAAPMPGATAEAVTAVIGADKMGDVFGMTETSPVYTFHPARRRKRGSVGFAVPGADVRIVDTETGTHTLPPGEPGEIICSGPQVMKGYLNMPEETAQALREIDGGIWMFSGDIGYMDEEGYVFLCDRKKDMLIVGGYKVFSVELEDKLKSMPCIAASAVVGTPDLARPGNDVVVLFVELAPEFVNENRDRLKEDILSFCRERMAPYKVPKRIIFAESIPLTPIGKVDKKALRSMLTEQGA